MTDKDHRKYCLKGICECSESLGADERLKNQAGSQPERLGIANPKPEKPCNHKGDKKGMCPFCVRTRRKKED